MRKEYIIPESVKIRIRLRALLEGSLIKEEGDPEWQGAKDMLDDEDIRDEDFLIRNLWEE